MVKIQNSLKRTLCSVGSLCMLASISNVGAWPWSKKNKEEKKPTTVEVKKESIEVIEAHRMYEEAVKETQETYSKYQEAAAKYKNAHIDTAKSCEDLQKADALWTEAVAERDAAEDRWFIDQNPNSEAYKKWREASQKVTEARRNKEQITIEWNQKREAEKVACEEREAAYKKYVASLVNQKSAHVNWSRVCIEDSKSRN